MVQAVQAVVLKEEAEWIHLFDGLAEDPLILLDTVDSRHSLL